MPIDNRDLAAGTRLVARYKKQEYTATVVEGEEGGLRYRLEDGREFKSPSAAGSAVMGGVACNGWRFWSVAGEAKQPTTRKPSPSKSWAQRRREDAAQATPRKSKAKKPTAKSQGFHRLPHEEGDAEGTAKYFCDACMEAFEAPAGEEPATCPKGHQPDGSPTESPV